MLKLSAVQSAILLAVGLQRKDVDVVEASHPCITRVVTGL